MAVVFDNKYTFVKKLGEGGFGTVVLAKENISNRFVAIKKINLNSTYVQNSLIKEIEIISQFKHPNIVSYYHHFFEEEKLFLVMEYCEEGNLREKINNVNTQANDVFNWIATLAGCLRLLHRKGIFRIWTKTCGVE